MFAFTASYNDEGCTGMHVENEEGGGVELKNKCNDKSHDNHTL